MVFFYGAINHANEYPYRYRICFIRLYKTDMMVQIDNEFGNVSSSIL